MITMITEYSTGPSTHLKVFYIYYVRCQFILLCMKGFLFVRGIFSGGVSYPGCLRSNHMGSPLRWSQPNILVAVLALPSCPCLRRCNREGQTSISHEVVTIIQNSFYDDNRRVGTGIYVAVLCHPYI